MSTIHAFKDAQRAQQSLLAPLEKKALIWMAARLPAWVNSDHLTGLGLLAMLGVGLSYWYASQSRFGLVLASAWLVVNWFGDSLDGTVARVRNQLRPRYGFYVDHICDAFGTFFMLGGLALSSYMSPPVAAALLIAYLLLNIEVYLTTYTLGAFHMSFWKFSPTELRLLLIVGNTALLYRPVTKIFGPPLLVYDVGGVIGAACIFATLVVTAIRHTRQLYREETKW
ncbi:MAG TPA: CDP-alcohol phosphatidyltransferase family protein [Acidobacteriota bacterium]|jgi:phosphatidylglycerophosphate synthase|nr:CDP-alcohol phosphatidyltransferase family protein [Acidobacteriota bacterium]HNT99639.1 CDP-alcohol phosphatidyltransferase family protein [Acidobacteriota bacterium]HPB27091.1 CDP-alcohol phosphatidyltransferase family protein [Acidobacteriota bacterium]